MLVLSRQRDQKIMIGDDIEITIVEIKGERVKIGIKAPPHIPVHRHEVYLAIKEANLKAVSGGSETVKQIEKLKDFFEKGKKKDEKKKKS